MKVTKIITAALALTLILSSCEDKPSAEILEAREVHHTIMDLETEVNGLLKTIKTDHKTEYDAIDSAEDSLRIRTFFARHQKLETLEKQLANWKENIAEVPGAHDGHDHGHDHGHEGHVHDHSKDEMLKNMTDAQILALQKDQLKSLEDIAAELKSLK